MVAQRGDDAERASKNGKTEGSIEGVGVTLEYGQPNVKSRAIWGGLVPYDEVWRTGANEATKLETGSDLKFGETTIQAGAYSIWAKKVASDDWRLLFNSEADIFGTDRKAENDLAETALENFDLPDSLEQFTITITAIDESEAEILMEWGHLQLRGTFTTTQ